MQEQHAKNIRNNSPVNKLFQNLPVPPRKHTRNMEQLLEEEDEVSSQTDGMIVLDQNNS